MHLFEYEKTGPEILQRCESRTEEGIVCTFYVYTKSIQGQFQLFSCIGFIVCILFVCTKNIQKQFQLSGIPKHGTTNTGGTLAQHGNTDETPEHWRNNETLEEQSEYHRIAEQQNNKTTPRNTTNTE